MLQHIGKYISSRMLRAVFSLILLLPFLILLFILDMAMISLFREWYLFPSYQLSSFSQITIAVFKYFFGFLMGSTLVSAYVYILMREESTLNSERWAMAIMVSGFLVISLKYVPFSFTSVPVVGLKEATLMQVISETMISTFYFLPAIFFIFSAEVGENEDFELEDVTAKNFIYAVYVKAISSVSDNLHGYFIGAKRAYSLISLIILVTFVLDYIGPKTILKALFGFL